MNEQEDRVRRASEAILSNESLTADLDDDAADSLLKWALSWVKSIAQSAAGDETESRDAPQLGALPKLIRLINRVASRPPADAQAGAAWLDEVLSQVALLHGDRFTPPGDEQRVAFLADYPTAEPAQRIARLRQLIEDSLAASPSFTQEKTHD